jgi:hypothetical protein
VARPVVPRSHRRGLIKTKEIAVHFATNAIEAEVAASALRARRLHPRVTIDPESPLVATVVGQSAPVECIILVPEAEAMAAREILRETKRRPT